ncbi:uncharacterized protein [Panulirus ornatus]|uniref:uncharacterized protein isoform X2 n=1 Tax=Panulirus ornatus TaxID=150431 RepID=UPI003A897E29
MKMGKCTWSGFVRSVKLVITFIFSHVGLCAFVAAYTVAGAFLFRQLEQKHIEAHYDPVLHRNNCFMDLYTITEKAGGRLNSRDWQEILESTIWQEDVKHRLMRFEQLLVTAVQDQVYDLGQDEQKDRWSVIGSLFYCVTVITTIGYGHVSPRTWEGKLVTIVYAIIGIPLMLLCLTNIGDSMATSFRFLYGRLCCRSDRQAEALPLTTLHSTRDSWESGRGQRYVPKRRNMLISPPISATIHRGSDNPFVADARIDASNVSCRPCAPRYPNTVHTADAEANRMVAECAAYTNMGVPGLVVTSHQDYDMVTLTGGLSPTTITPNTAEVSVASSPVTRDDTDDWPGSRYSTYVGNQVSESQTEPNPCNPSTRTCSPTVTISTTSLPPGTLSNPWPRQESCPSTGSLMPYGSDVEEQSIPARGRITHSPAGKTLVVYNTLSGDALLEQSKVARKIALMNKGGFGQVQTHATTVFTDPVSGQAVNGDMLGLNYRPIPPDISDVDNRVPIPIVLAFVVSYIGIGALLFSWLEGWTLLDAGYFCFITLSTIGFGDFVPGKSLGYDTQEAQIKLVTGSLYLMFGLAVLAMSFNLVQEEVVLKCKAFALWIGLMKE